MPADLHIHTRFSDGDFSPEEIVRKAKDAGLTTIAITDHDVLAGIDEALSAGKKYGIEVIPGIEISTDIPHTEIHMLGYFMEYGSEDLINQLRDFKDARRERIYRIVKKLKAVKINIDPLQVFEIAGHGTAGRPHVAQTLFANGLVGSIREAFERFLSVGKPAYVPHEKLTPAEAVKFIKKFKGIPVLAHPGSSEADELIPPLISEGLRGLEVFYPSHSQEQVHHYYNLAKKYGLLVTGGSDFHGPSLRDEVELGSVRLEERYVEALKLNHQELGNRK